MAAKNQVAAPKPAPGANQALEKMQAFWKGLRPQQQLFLGVGLALTLGVVIFFGKMIATPDFKPLLKGLEPGDVQAITTQLDAKKIAYKIGPDGTSISVPADQVDAARLEVASHDSTGSGRIGFEIFDKVSWGQTEFDEKVNYQRALEGELERTIQTMGNVKSARVHIVMANDSVFMDRERGAKASVTLKLKHGALSREDQTSIARLVAGAVDELKPSDVTIIDADSSQSLRTGENSGDGSDSIEQQLTRRLVATLGPVVGGSDHIRSTVNVEYETGSSEENDEKYDPAVSATLTMQHTEETTGPGVVNGGVPGTSSNVPAAKAAAPPTAKQEMGQSSKTDNNTYGVNKVVRHVIEPAGSIKRITAAVVVDDAIERKNQGGKWVEVRHKRQPDELKLISDLAQAAIGYNSTRGDVISVQNLAFEHADAEDIPPATIVDKARKGLSDFSSEVRYGVLLVLFLLVYFLMIRPVQKRVMSAPLGLTASQEEALLRQHELAPIPDSPAVLAQRSLMLKKQLSEFVRSDPESSVTAVRSWIQEEA
jgi:flagellar M-ring protein FliF